MLNVDRVMRTDYVIDDLQPTYFVIESFEDLYHQTVERDFDRLYRSLAPGFTYANAAVIDVDDVLHRGTQEYLLRGGRGSGRAAGLTANRKTGPGSLRGRLVRSANAISSGVAAVHLVGGVFVGFGLGVGLASRMASA